MPYSRDPSYSAPSESLSDFVRSIAAEIGAPGNMLNAGEAIAAQWQTFFGCALNAVHASNAAADRRAALARFLHESNENLRRRIEDNGVTYNVYAEDASQSRPWSLDLLPMIVPEAEWQTIERGVLQRVRLLNDVLNDVSGEQSLIKRGLLPSAIVHGHPGYRRAAHGIVPRGGTHLHIAGFDLARGADGTWWIISHRTDAPSGLGYLLENRMIVSRLFPDAFRALKIERVVTAYKALIASLAAHSPKGESARIVLLTPGPFNETYFEHVYLARYLGIPLVEGGDLVVRDQRVWLKTLTDLEAVDVIVRRLDDDFLDPLELRADSALGVPGLLQAYRAGNVVLANAPGSSWLESSAVLAFLPKISDALYGEAMALPSIATWWCGEKPALRSMLPQLDQLVLKPTFNDKPRRFVPLVGKHMTQKESEQWIARISAKPENFVAQSYLPLSHTPTFTASADAGAPLLDSRAAMMRVYAVSDGPNRWRVLPGGLARIAPAGKEIVSMYRGGSSADVWAITGRVREDTAPLSTMLTPISEVRATLGISSRAAENLFWFGRYTERLDNSVRLARIALEALISNDEELPSTEEWISRLAVENGLVAEAVPTMRQSSLVFERALIASLSDREATLGTSSVAATLSALGMASFSVRERLALEQWTLVAACEQEFAAALGNDANRPATAQTALRALERLALNVMAMTGAQADRMTRDDGWRLLSIGRNVERLITLSHALAEAFATKTIENDTGFTLVLGLFDSTITYRSRYLQRRDPQALIELLALDRGNPRSLTWVSQTLRSRLAKLEDTPMGVTPELLRERMLPHQWTMDSLAPALAQAANGDTDAIADRLRSVIDEARGLSNVLSQRYFTHAEHIQTVGVHSTTSAHATAESV
jgi:uncharacterized circularly permuted ATP-grasp superfamily protein/uncharacterized alpha-E superfamily protein